MDGQARCICNCQWWMGSTWGMFWVCLSHCRLCQSRHWWSSCWSAGCQRMAMRGWRTTLSWISCRGSILGIWLHFCVCRTRRPWMTCLLQRHSLLRMICTWCCLPRIFCFMKLWTWFNLHSAHLLLVHLNLAQWSHHPAVTLLGRTLSRLWNCGICLAVCQMTWPLLLHLPIR